MRTFVLLISVLLVPFPALAGPTILGVDGTVVAGQRLRVTGAGFGEKPPGAAPLFFDNFEGAEAVEGISIRGRNASHHGAWRDQGFDDGTPVYSSENQRPGSRLAAFAHLEDSASQNHCDATTEFSSKHVDRLLISLWFSVRYDHHLVDHGETPDPARVRGWQYKTWRVLDASGQVGDGASSLLHGVWFFSDDKTNRFMQSYYQRATESVVFPSTETNKIYSNTPVDGTWHQYVVFVKASAQGDGSLDVYTNGVRKTTDADLDSLTNYDPAGDSWRRLIIGYYLGTEGWHRDGYAANPELWSYYDDIYVDRTWQSAWLCSGPTMESHCEVQLPTAWSDSQVEVEVNQGALDPAKEAYLLVIDADGAKATKQVTWGEGLRLPDGGTTAAPDATAPDATAPDAMPTSEADAASDGGVSDDKRPAAGSGAGTARLGGRGCDVHGGAATHPGIALLVLVLALGLRRRRRMVRGLRGRDQAD